MPVLGVKMQRRLSAEGVLIDESFEEQRRNSLSPSPRRRPRPSLDSEESFEEHRYALVLVRCFVHF